VRFHLIGVCGTGMGALAGLLKEAGHDVRGSDQNVYPPMSDLLAARGIAAFEGYRPENLDWGPDRVVVGNACRRDHVEVVAAQARGLPLVSFPATLSEMFLADRHPVVVAGTHGKTTTTALLAWLLAAAGRDPSLLVGGVARNFDTSARLGWGPHFVVEGDEYDTAFFDKGPKFHHYRPRTLLVTGIEYDHADIFPSVEAIVREFERLVAGVPPEGRLFLCADDARAPALAAHARAPVVTYGTGASPDARAGDVEIGRDGVHFDLWLGGERLGRFASPLAGRHNLQNAVGALAAAASLGLAPEELARGLATFAGVKRRQEVVGVAAGVVVVDDFAHHPTAVRETIAAIRARHPEGRVLALFEPRTNTSRRSIFQREYAQAFEGASLVAVAPPFGVASIAPEERFDAERLALDLCERGIDAHAPPSVDAIVELVAGRARPEDVVLCMSTGGFGGIHRKLLAALEKDR
jgi:UDP-N-acetylmuramate: L-alanyl-gamma-D-glutamyl-meso-diaminopimelate ligase